MRCLLALLGLSAIGQLLGATQADAQEFAVPESARAAIIDQTNAYRAIKGLPPLRENQEASREAQAYAAYLAVTMRQGHSADGRSPFQRLRASGASSASSAARIGTSPGRVRRAYCRRPRWMRPCGSGKHSPGHERALRSASTEIGVGIAGWRHGEQWYYQEIQVFIDTACLKGAEAQVPPPPLPDRNPARP